MSLARFTPTDLLNSVGRFPAGWRGRYPTVKQISVFRDRNIPLPLTRGEAASVLKEMARKEGWGE